MHHEDEEVVAKRVLARADKTLAEVDEAFIVTERGHEIRPMPTFRPEEVSLGKQLGKGGFGVVNEIKGFFLDPDETPKLDEPPDDPHIVETENENPQEDTGKSKRTRIKAKSTSHVHYDINEARHIMEGRAMKDGVARYAIKRLHNELTPVEKARGMIDLAVEAKMLSIVFHPNIIKMRGMAKGPMIDDYFFIILDRLYETLDLKINHWYEQDKHLRGHLFGIGKDKSGMRKMLVERMTVAYDLAAAFFYLHENRIVYRDIKPENIGFDFRGDAKVFDFGLAKSLNPKLKAKEGYGYRLTGRAGSLPYMAPEVVCMKTYDTKCDVFSFAILLWEILALRKAFDGFTPTKFVEKVTLEDERLVIQKSWPALTRLMLPEAWDADPAKRPDMKRVAILIRGDLNTLTSDEAVLKRTKHMLNRSQHSFNE